MRAAQAWKWPDRALWGRYRQQYVWRCPAAGCHGVVEPAVLPAAAAIDWSLRGQRIGDRARPLAEKTLRRIEAGLRKYARPIAIPVEGRIGKAAAPVEEPLRTQTARNETGVAVPPALLMPAGGTWSDTARTVAEPLPTRTTRDADALVCPPFLALLRSDRARTLGVNGPLATVVADGSNHALVQPFVVELRGGGSHARAVADPLATITAAGNHHGLVIPPASTA